MTGLADVLRRRRMVRRFDPARPVDPAQLEVVLQSMLRAPSAGFTQGVSLLVLAQAAERDAFWAGTAEGTSRWLAGMRTAPALVLVWTSESTYLDRYAEPDKGWSDRDVDRWSAPYWFVDAGMSSMAGLLAAVDLDLGACFFGVPVDRIQAVRDLFAVPPDQLSVGVIALGHPLRSEPTGSPTRRPRKPTTDLIHHGRWSGAGAATRHDPDPAVDHVRPGAPQAGFGLADVAHDV